MSIDTPIILAIETATEACSAALIRSSDTQESFGRFKLAPREHTKLILPMLDEVLEESGLTIADVDAIAFGQGPGAFTGLRIATGIAQGLALSIDKPLIPVSTLMALALQAKDKSNAKLGSIVIATIDARMGEIYWGAFKVTATGVESIEEEQVSGPAFFQEKLQDKAHQLAQENNALIVTGSGWDAYFANIDEHFTGDALTSITHIKGEFPNAMAVAKIALPLFIAGELSSVEDAQPVYLRNNVAEKSKK